MILLTFNILNHNQKLRNGQQLSATDLLDITVKNTSSLLRILEVHEQRSTFFVAVSLVESLPGLLKKIIAEGHEIALFNDGAGKEEIIQIKNRVQEIIGKQVRGIRQENHLLTAMECREAGFTYVSNIEHADILFPFKRLERSTEILEKDGISIVPDSISPYSQLPYNDFVFQVLPAAFYENMVNETLKNEDFVLIYLNTWQFTDPQKFPLKIPFYRRYNSGKNMEDKLDHFLSWINEHQLATSRIKDYIF